MALPTFSPIEDRFFSASLLRCVCKRLSDSRLFPDYQQAFSDVQAGWKALDISDMGNTKLGAVRSVVLDLISEIIANGLSNRGGDQSYNALSDSLTELQISLNAAM